MRVHLAWLVALAVATGGCEETRRRPGAPPTTGTPSPTDTGVTAPEDTGVDAGNLDVGQTPVDFGLPPADTGVPDRGFADVDIPDRGFIDAGFPDRGFPDLGFPDQGFPDQGFPDTGVGNDAGSSGLTATVVQSELIIRTMPGGQDPVSYTANVQFQNGGAQTVQLSATVARVNVVLMAIDVPMTGSHAATPGSSTGRFSSSAPNIDASLLSIACSFPLPFPIELIFSDGSIASDTVMPTCL